MSLLDVATKAKKSNTGGASYFLAKVKNPNDLPTVPAITFAPVPAFPGDVDAFMAANGDTEALRRMLKNKVKKCTQCAKPNAFSLATCNQCGRTLSDVPVSYTNNVFTSFIFGIAKGPFPFSISLRYQSDDVMVFDDLLGLGPCHINVIPTSHYIPDWRFLLRRPSEGLAIINKMYAACVEVITTQFLTNAAWRARFIRSDVTDAEVIAGLATGFNYPPSQYQLHTQCMVPHVLPFQYYQYKCGVHFTYKRFFPSPYVRAVLEALIASKEPLPAALLMDDTSVDVLIPEIKIRLGVDYDESHGEMIRIFDVLQTKFANYEPSMFEGIVVDNSMYVSWDGTETKTSPEDIVAIVNGDKTALQSYGRPYKEGNKPSGSYYGLTKKPEQLTIW